MKRASTSQEQLRREAADWLARLQGPAGEADHTAFQDWYGADPARAEAYDRVKALYESAGLLAQTELGRSRALPEPTRSSGRARSYAMAASVAALLLISGAVLLGRPEALMRPAEAEVLHFATGVGEIRQVPLPDGSHLTLDTKTTVSVELGPDRRQVMLREGRARFVVASGDRRPFVVEAGDSRVTGQGGTFDVALRDGATTVQPIDGSVTVESASERAASTPVRLAPGQAILVSADGERLQAREPRRSEALWPSGMLVFDSTPLGEAIAEANRYSGARITLGDPSLARLRVSGTFRAGDLEGLARSLEAAFGLRLERASEGHFVLHPRSRRQRPIHNKKGG